MLILNAYFLLRCCKDSEYMGKRVGRQKKMECEQRQNSKSSDTTSTGADGRLTCNVPLTFKRIHGFGKHGIEEKGSENGKLDNNGKCLTLTYTPSDHLTNENVTFKLSGSNYCVRIEFTLA